MNKFSKAVTITLLSIFTFSCANQEANIATTNQQANISSVNTEKADALSFKLIKGKDIPDNILQTTYTQSKDMSDKESKRRGVPLFNLPKNPIGLEISSGTDKLGYILNYIGTPTETEDVNVEVKALYSTNSSAYSLNYSGPLTQSRKQSYTTQKPAIKTTKDNDFSYELIQGLPPENILDTFEGYLNNLGDNLKKYYQPQDVSISNDDVFIYAIHYKGDVVGFFFESHANKVVLGERKYADMQIGVFITANNKIKGNYTLVEFNPKTKSGQDPVYKTKSQGSLNLIQLGEL